MDVSYKFSAFGGTPPRRVRDGDPHGRRLRHGGSVFGGNSLPRKYSPTRLEYFVRNHRPAGARPDPAGQYANPYTYGGDPVNYVDPAGLFSFDTGLLTIGWTCSGVKALNMMSGSSNWERYMNTHHFEDGPDKDNATIGVPVLLRVWAGEMTNGMDNAAVQLGFEFWKRARRPLPRLSGLVAREKGIDDKEAERGIAAAKALSERIIRVSESDGSDSVSQATKQALSAVSWRLSRFARLRADDQLANRLDSLNDAVKHMMGILEYERMRTFMQLTPYEGLRLALRRADFIEARRYGAAVLAIDQGDPEANFGTGMAYLMEEKLREAELYLERCLKARPEEPAVLNNLAIIYRKTNRLDKALEYAKKAHDLLPDNEEIKKTLADTERAIEGKARAVKSAVGR